MSKYKGIDSRQIKCCDPSETTIESGISFEVDGTQNILRFHFLDYINQDKDNPILHQVTKSMWLNKENLEQLIKALQDLVFVEYYDVKDKLPPIGKWVKIFHEECTMGGYGFWHEGYRVSDTHFKRSNSDILIDLTNRTCLGIGVTHWADISIPYALLPNISRRKIE